jgi:hypothetical protein
MQNRLAMCATHLREVEERLLELKKTAEKDDMNEWAKITEDLSYVHQARQAVSETKSRVDSLHEPRKAD